MSWNELAQPQYRWIPPIEKIISHEKPPALNGPLIYITSDYSGQNKESRYEVISVLYLDLESSKNWEESRRRIRGRYLPDGRRIAFKDLNDRRRRRAIIPFLRAANSIDGICVTFAFKKTLTRLFTTVDTLSLLDGMVAFKSAWTKRSFEKMVRIAQLVSILVGGLSKPGQHIYWVSDEDEVFANVSKSQDLRQMVSMISSYYVKHPMGELGLGTTAMDEGDRFEEDLAAIPDMAAGAIAEITTRLSILGGGFISPTLAIPFDREFSPKSELILSWLADRSQKLRRVTILFEKMRSGQLAVSRLDLPSR